jgi:outer membrane lipoprotein SlyB
MISSATLRRGGAALALSALAITGLSACADEAGPGYYPPYAEGRIAQVREGTVVSFRPVQFGPGDTTGGTILGGVGGAVLGSAVAGRGDRGVGALLGGIGGALLGNAVASGNRVNGFAYTIRRPDGGLVEIAQADPYPIAAGTRVTITFGAGRGAHVAPINGAYPPLPPPPPPPPPPGA